ncbi:formate/nitrite transporter family protein [uncultured Jannaschia sp.]|uniref:formate/nitrite transporter family protein n=1 Tax=uncultured Jannaschia sp. TaxID=293347 RepID=UPI00262FBBC3|nr:formate/nitrite transporter family protein [uncultured Jannaschia sp.]
MSAETPDHSRAGSEKEAGEKRKHRPKTVIDEASSLTEAEEEKVVDRLSLRAPAVYAVIKEEGEAEIARPTGALFWSGLVAGIAMGFSVLTLALMQMHLPDTEWAPLVASVGYATGFLIVILGRQQLFTENTITVVLPLVSERSRSALGQVARVWSVVLIANWIGCVVVALGLVTFSLVPADVSAAVLDVSQHYAELTAFTAFRQGIGAGFLIAAMVWMMPAAQGSEFVLVTATAWLIALGGFTHVIAGMVEIAALVLAGELSVVDGLLTLTLPTLAGNVLGGTGLFTLLAYAQVKSEVDAADPVDEPPAGPSL